MFNKIFYILYLLNNTMHDHKSHSCVFAPDSNLSADLDREAIAVMLLKKAPKKFVIPMARASLKFFKIFS